MLNIWHNLLNNALYIDSLFKYSPLVNKVEEVTKQNCLTEIIMVDKQGNSCISHKLPHFHTLHLQQLYLHLSLRNVF